jgi:hypothetical protein
MLYLGLFQNTLISFQINFFLTKILNNYNLDKFEVLLQYFG